MRLIRGLHNLPPFEQGSVVTIGAFDGVHLGHQALLNDILAQSKTLGLPSVVICFEPLPREFFAPKDSPSRLMNFREKFEALAALGIDYCLRIQFNDRLRQMSATQFIDDVFVNGLNAKHITIGDDFRFGYDRLGGKALLVSLAEQHGYAINDTPSICQQDERISSSAIRAALEKADFAQAQLLLGKAYEMHGRVVYGRQLGRTLGFPTANIQIHRHKSAMSGVYVVTITLPDGRCLPAVANCGVRPSVDDGIKAILEVHVFDLNESLYGQRVSVQFLQKLRDEKKFESLPDLQAAIDQDASQARQWFLDNALEAH